jgi:ribosome-associated translation inhibitor RaiA
MPEQLVVLRAETERSFQRIVEAQARTDERLTALVEAQKQTDERLTALAEAQARTDTQLAKLSTRVEELTEAQTRTDAQLQKLTQVVGVLVNDVGDLKGRNLEADYRTKGHAYFSRMVRRPHVLSSDELVELVESARDQRRLSAEQAQEIYDADVIVRGKRPADGNEVYLVVEVSWGVGPHDVERAVERAALFARIGAIAIPVVAGKQITAPAVRLAQEKQVWQVTNGSVKSPESAT